MNRINCIFYDELPSTDEQVYARIGNRLARMRDLHIDELEVIEKLVEEERARRSQA